MCNRCRDSESLRLVLPAEPWRGDTLFAALPLFGDRIDDVREPHACLSLRLSLRLSL